MGHGGLSDVVHSTAPKQSHPTHAIPKQCSSACSESLQILELWSPESPGFLALLFC